MEHNVLLFQVGAIFLLRYADLKIIQRIGGDVFSHAGVNGEYTMIKIMNSYMMGFFS